ncbi:hypothetical protein [Pelagicoccus sp. SDUM812003]|uniref:hypothetical protein n=1 Tax=Pelagicoccus sp. SDUM812003 TaxID=3041267 RepID=UPI00280E383F|nr:hypothetical protein [Pelagicoccus sp. SDUM812003]MDQ8203774.1 hypothetical protein [Pelagicoccus sp. SDUM812003]
MTPRILLLNLPHRLNSCRILAAALLLVVAGASPGFAQSLRGGKVFEDYYQLDPFEVVGEEIPITVFARSNADRRYALKVAHAVIEVVYVTLERSPGAGLVIIGESDEPHPVFVFRRFLELAESEAASPELKRMGLTLGKELQDWRDSIHIDLDEDEGEEIDIDETVLVSAFPLPLDGIASALYTLAWEEGFDERRIDERLRNTSVEGLQQGTISEFDWVFYLPPRSSLNELIKEALPAMMKREKVGFFKRALVRGAIATFKPMIKDMFEGIRKGIFYASILEQQGVFNEGDLKALFDAYVGSQMPRGRILPGDKVDWAIDAVEAQKVANEEYAKDPYIAPIPLQSYDLDDYKHLKGVYIRENDDPHYFVIENGGFRWQYQDWENEPMIPAGDSTFVSENGELSLRFFEDPEDGQTKVDLRKGRFRQTYTHLSSEVDR